MVKEETLKNWLLAFPWATYNHTNQTLGCKVCAASNFRTKTFFGKGTYNVNKCKKDHLQQHANTPDHKSVAGDVQETTMEEVNKFFSNFSESTRLPAPPTPIAQPKGMPTSNMAWTSKENAALAQAWIATLEDSEMLNPKKGQIYVHMAAKFKEIMSQDNENSGEFGRSLSALAARKRWSRVRGYLYFFHKHYQMNLNRPDKDQNYAWKRAKWLLHMETNNTRLQDAHAKKNKMLEEKGEPLVPEPVYLQDSLQDNPPDVSCEYEEAYKVVMNNRHFTGRIPSEKEDQKPGLKRNVEIVALRKKRKIDDFVDESTMHKNLVQSKIHLIELKREMTLTKHWEEKQSRDLQKKKTNMELLKSLDEDLYNKVKVEVANDILGELGYKKSDFEKAVKNIPQENISYDAINEWQKTQSTSTYFTGLNVANKPRGQIKEAFSSFISGFAGSKENFRADLFLLISGYIDAHTVTKELLLNQDKKKYLFEMVASVKEMCFEVEDGANKALSIEALNELLNDQLLLSLLSHGFYSYLFALNDDDDDDDDENADVEAEAKAGDGKGESNTSPKGERQYYFDCAGRSPLLNTTYAIGQKTLQIKRKPWNHGPDEKIINDIKTTFATLIHADDPNDISIANTTSYNLSAAAQTLYHNNVFTPNEDVIILSDQMASNVYPWQHFCRKSGANLNIINRKEPCCETDCQCDLTTKIIKNIKSTASILAIPNCHWCDGELIDLEKIRNENPDLTIVLDVTQSLGVIPLDISKIKPSFLCASVHKWLLAPYGFSVMYVDKQFQTSTTGFPLEHFERNRLGADKPEWDNLGMMTNAGLPETFQPGASMFNSGGRPNPITLPMLRHSIQEVLAFSPERLHISLQCLTEYLSMYANSLGFAVPSHRAPHIVGISLPKNNPQNLPPPTFLESYLKKKNIHVSVRVNTLRISIYIYITLDDVKYLCECLRQAVEVYI